MRYLKLFESFEDIDSICKKWGIRNYTINPDGTVDVDGSVSLAGRGLTELPIKFGVVSGIFWCHKNQLTTLKGAPNRVGGSFLCKDNQLTTLEGAPKEVGGTFWCQGNQLTTLKGGPMVVGVDFYCEDNQLTTIEGFPREVGRVFDCSGNPIDNIYKLYPDYDTFIDSMEVYNYLRGTNIVRGRFSEAMDDINKKMPKSIPGYKYI